MLNPVISLLLCTEKLLTKEKHRIERIDYLPIIQSYYYLAEYMESIISKEKLISSIIKTYTNLMDDNYRSQKINELLSELMPNIPEEIKVIKKSLILN